MRRRRVRPAFGSAGIFFAAGVLALLALAESGDPAFSAEQVEKPIDKLELMLNNYDVPVKEPPEPEESNGPEEGVLGDGGVSPVGRSPVKPEKCDLSPDSIQTRYQVLREKVTGMLTALERAQAEMQDFFTPSFDDSDCDQLIQVADRHIQALDFDITPIAEGASELERCTDSALFYMPDDLKNNSPVSRVLWDLKILGDLEPHIRRLDTEAQQLLDWRDDLIAGYQTLRSRCDRE